MACGFESRLEHLNTSTQGVEMASISAYRKARSAYRDAKNKVKEMFLQKAINCVAMAQCGSPVRGWMLAGDGVTATCLRNRKTYDLTKHIAKISGDGRENEVEF